MVDRETLWRSKGLRQLQLVRCKVTEHRDYFGVDVEVVSPVTGIPAFIDFVLLAEAGTPVTPEDFPAVGSVLDAVTVDFMPDGELRLSARPSTVAMYRQRASE
jgi:hypothetical protein